MDHPISTNMAVSPLLIVAVGNSTIAYVEGDGSSQVPARNDGSRTDLRMGHGQRGRLASFEQGLDIVPSFEDVPEFVEGPLEGFWVQVTAEQGYFEHLSGGYDVDPETLELL